VVHCAAGAYVYGVMYLAGFSVLCTVAVLSMHHRRRNPAPRILRRVVHDVIGRMLCMNDGNCKVIPQSYDRDRLTWLMVLPRDAVLVRYLLLRVSVSSVRASVRHKPVSHQNDWTNQAGFWHGGFFSTYPTLSCKEIRVLQKIRDTSLWNFAPNYG